MPRFDDKHVMVTGCTVVWDGVTRPETDPQTGKVKYTLKVVISPQSPDLADYNILAQETLQNSEFNGVLPAGGLMPIGQTKAGEFNNLFPGHAVISAKTFYPPDVYDETGAKLDPMQYAPAIYSGQRVDVLLHCYAYNKMGNQGVAAGLDGLRIVASAAAPKLDIGTGGVDTAAAFGAPTAPPAAGYRAETLAAQPGAPLTQPPAQAVVPSTATPTGGFDPQTGQPIYPQQAQNFLPAQTPVTATITGYDPNTGQPIYSQ